MRRPREEFDSPWKDALERWLEPFFALCFPAIHAEIDWSRTPEFLDNELRRVTRRALVGPRRVDRLVRVWRRDGSEAWVLIHLEVQAQVEALFPRRMFQYNYRIFDRFDQAVCSLAVLADPDPNWRPAAFPLELWGCRTGIVYPIVKLLDFRPRWEELERSDNPFAAVIMAHLKALETRRAPRSRYEWKMRIARGLYEHRWSGDQIRELYRLVDWVMKLPEGLDHQFEQEFSAWEAREQMPYVTGIERRAIERGRREGRIEELHESVLANLAHQMGEVPEDLRERVLALADVEQLRRLRAQALTVDSLEEFWGELEH